MKGKLGKISRLSPTDIFVKVVRRIKPLDAVAQRVIRRMVTKSTEREKLNTYYQTLDYAGKNSFHQMFHRAFSNGTPNPLEGEWKINFLGSCIKLPFREKTSWLDWENAISILGHDVDVKRTYETLLKSKYRPTVFFDIGANYGTHSLLFISQGIKTVSFEPNPSCKKEFDEFCRLNEFSGQMENVAVSNEEGTVDFWFPEKETWLGTISESTKEGLRSDDLQKLRVPLITIDSYSTKSGLQPDLIKIDTEGNEVNVIEGATETIKKAKPLIIFECNDLSNRRDLQQTFNALNYQICLLPLLLNKPMISLNSDEFAIDDAHNYIAVPQAHSVLEQPTDTKI